MGAQKCLSPCDHIDWATRASEKNPLDQRSVTWLGSLRAWLIGRCSTFPQWKRSCQGKKCLGQATPSQIQVCVESEENDLYFSEWTLLSGILQKHSQHSHRGRCDPLQQTQGLEGGGARTCAFQWAWAQGSGRSGFIPWPVFIAEMCLSTFPLCLLNCVTNKTVKL